MRGSASSDAEGPGLGAVLSRERSRGARLRPAIAAVSERASRAVTRARGRRFRGTVPIGNGFPLSAVNAWAVTQTGVWSLLRE